ncbi:MAG: lipid-A-disaccharide synthase [Betaproteobacteria bacterium]|nr:lipid-A-disaccharide synthase [Betaproteobacteria bacterium]
MKVGIVAGEASGDLLGAHLVNALKNRVPGIEFVGVGGPKMQAAGVHSLFPMETLAVRGYVEVLRHYREIIGIRRKLHRHFVDNPPDVFIGVDAPDFNLDLEMGLKKRGIPTVHYVSPSIWAWRGERIRKIARAVSHVLTLFPFEKKIYDGAGIPVTYVGHPSADIAPEHPDRKAAREQLKLPPGATVIAMLPGSRQSELHYMAKLFVQTARMIVAVNPNVQFLVPLVSRETRNMFEAEIYRSKCGDLPLTVLFGHAHTAMVAADAALVASGTATLEAALLKCPMVITYKMSPLTWRMMQRKTYLPYVGLPNILEGRFIVPELLQDDATPENLSQAMLNLVSDKLVREKLTRTFSGLHLQLKQNTAERAVDAILPLLV